MKHTSSSRDYETHNVRSLWGFSMDTAKQGQNQNVATQNRTPETSRRRDHGKGREPENHGKDGKGRGPGLSLAGWKPLAGYTKPRPPKLAGQSTVSERPPKHSKLYLKNSRLNEQSSLRPGVAPPNVVGEATFSNALAQTQTGVTSRLLGAKNTGSFPL